MQGEQKAAPAPGVAGAGADRNQDVLAIEIAGTVLSLAAIRMRLTPSHPLRVSLCWRDRR